MYLIYKYTNKINNKVYIGQTSTTLDERAGCNGSNYRGSPRFFAAIKKHSWDSFIPEIIDSVDSQDKANELEKYYIDKYNSTNDLFGYNISIGGDCASMNDVAKSKISLKAKERYKDRTKNPMYGKERSSDTKKLMSALHSGENNPMYGSTWNEAQRSRSGTKGKKLHLSDDQRRVLSERCSAMGKITGRRSVRCVEDDLCFDSIVEAADYYGVTKGTLCGHLKGESKTCKGKHFTYND